MVAATALTTMTLALVMTDQSPLVGALLSGAHGSASKPHLIFALIDDWGWFDNGFHGNGLIKTPFMDQLVKDESALIERHYTFKFCSPTRRSFLSGRVPPHSGQSNSAAATVDMRMQTIADKLKSANYVTGQAGKWHAGHFAMSQTPKGRGFNTSLGYFNGACDHWTQEDGEDGCAKRNGFPTTDLWDTERPGYGMNGTYGDYMYVGRAVKTIQAHDPSVPLFFYLAMQCAHSPMEAPQRFLDLFDPETTPNQVEYAFSSVIDEGIKNVTTALKSKAMWQNTLLVVSSDNGGPSFSDQHAASNWPLRGGKYTFFEGGVRVNAFVTGGLLPAAMRGKNITGPIHICDWYATFSKLAGVDPTDSHEGVPDIDSIDAWPAISGLAVSSTTAVRSEIFIGSGVLIQGPHKLIATGAGVAQWSGPRYPKVPATGPKSLNCSSTHPCLFDIEADPWERQDVAEANPAIVSKMVARLAVLMKGVFEGHGPEGANQSTVCAATARNLGYLTPSDFKGPPPHLKKLT